MLQRESLRRNTRLVRRAAAVFVQAKTKFLAVNPISQAEAFMTLKPPNRAV